MKQVDAAQMKVQVETGQRHGQKLPLKVNRMCEIKNESRNIALI